MERCICLIVLLAVSFGFCTAAIVQPDNTCSFGNNYLQLVGFACVASEERVRDPSAANQANIDAWEDYGNYNIWSYHTMNRLINRNGISIGGITYCSNFTVRFKEESKRWRGGKEHFASFRASPAARAFMFHLHL